MKKWLLSLCMVLALTACDEKKETAQANSKPVVKIGVSLPLTGDAANVGNAVKASVNMALEEWKQKDTKYNYEVVFEDDALQTAKAAMVANKFINMDKVNAIMNIWGVTAPVVADVAEKTNTIFFTCAGYIDNENKSYVFNNYTPNKRVSEALIKKLKKLNVKTVAFASDMNAVGDARAKYVVEDLRQAGIDVVAVERYIVGTVDFRMSIAKMEALNPDYYIIFVEQPGTKNFIEQHKQITGKDNLAAIDVFHEMPKKYWSAADGLWFVKSANGTSEFEDKFYKNTGLEIQSCVGNSYDNLNLIINAFENAPIKEGQKVPSNEDVIVQLHQAKDVDGAIGKISVDEDGNVDSLAVIQKMIDGEQVLDEE